jgi:hypothetical protein
MTQLTNLEAQLMKLNGLSNRTAVLYENREIEPKPKGKQPISKPP